MSSSQALCCPLKGAVIERDEPEMRLCDGVFDAMVRFRAERMFDSGEEGFPTTRLHSFVFKDDLVYAFDVFGAAKVIAVDNIAIVRCVNAVHPSEKHNAHKFQTTFH